MSIKELARAIGAFSRNGNKIFTRQFGADLSAVKEWLLATLTYGNDLI